MNLKNVLKNQSNEGKRKSIKTILGSILLYFMLQYVLAFIQSRYQAHIKYLQK
jgi:hypothetical protein